jgi:threonine/homoserine/homoserine lactone efflux protein
MTDFLASPYWPELIQLAILYFIAVVSPGPDFAMTLRNSLVYSRRTGLMGALGTTTGMTVHLSYTIFGISYLVNQYPSVLLAIKYVGACWLAYIGLKSMISKRVIKTVDQDVAKAKQDLSPWQAFRAGFFTNALNPFCIVFFMGLLADKIHAGMPTYILGLYAGIVVTIALGWFATVVFFFTQEHVHALFNRLGLWLERITGGLLVAFGLRLAFSAI